MRYGFFFKLNVCEVDSGERFAVMSTSGDYTRSQDWVDANAKEVGAGRVREIREGYALLWFALRRKGLLDEHGLSAQLDAAVLDGMGDKWALDIENVEDDAPLAS